MTKLTAQSKTSIPDSLRTIEVEKWRVERLIHDAYTLRALQQYASKLEQETSIANKLIVAQDSTLNIRAQTIKDQATRIDTSDARLENQVKLTKHERRQKNKFKVVTFTIIAVGVYVIVRGISGG